MWSTHPLSPPTPELPPAGTLVRNKYASLTSPAFTALNSLRNLHEYCNASGLPLLSRASIFVSSLSGHLLLRCYLSSGAFTTPLSTRFVNTNVISGGLAGEHSSFQEYLRSISLGFGNTMRPFC